MKKIKVSLIAFCGTLLLSSCGGGVVKKEKKSDREEMGLVGKVESLRTVSESGKGTLYVFNEAGNLLRKSSVEEGMDMDMEEKLLAEYAYGDDGKIESISHYSNMDGSLETKEVYDANGNMTALEKYNNTYGSEGRVSKLYSTQHFVYDEKGLLVKSYMNDNEGNATEYKCDAAGNILEQTDRFMGKVSRILRFSYQYDNRGNITEECQYTPEIPGDKSPATGKEKEKKVYKYDKNDFMLEQVQSSYTHDEKEHYLKQERVFKYTPDEHQNPVEVISSVYTYPEPQVKDGEKHYSEGIPVTMEYTYDAQGNWTDRKRVQGKQVTYDFRTIVYFEN